MLKKGQTQQIFVWISILIVAIMILFFGIKLINKTINLKDDVLVVKFLNDFDKKLSQYYYLDTGSEGKERFSLPSDVGYVCFVDGTGIGEEWGSRISLGDQTIIQNLEDYSDIFVGPLGLYNENRANLTIKFSLDEKYKCFNVDGGILAITLKNEGVVKGVKIR